MSQGKSPEIRKIARLLSRDLRKNSTKSEKIFWEIVRKRRVLGKKFYRQYPFFIDIFGKETFDILDFYCHENKLAVEIDGKYHTKQKHSDELRSSALNSLGIKVIRFKNEEIENHPHLVLKSLKNILLL